MRLRVTFWLVLSGVLFLSVPVHAENFWKYIGGAPAKQISRPDQADAFVASDTKLHNPRRLDETAIEEWKLRFETTDAETITVYSPVDDPLKVLATIHAHSWDPKKPIVRWDVTCPWEDKKTGTRITEIPALSYGHLEWDGMRYPIFEPLGCGNLTIGYGKPIPPPRVVRRTPAPTPDAPWSPPTTGPAPAGAFPSRWDYNGVLWLTYEHDFLHHGKSDVDNVFSGVELIGGSDHLALVGRVSPNYCLRSGSGEARIGVRWSPINGWPYYVGIEGGGYGTYKQHRYHRDFQRDAKGWQSGGGWYGRAIAYYNASLYTEAVYQTGNRLKHRYDVQATIEHGIYARVSFVEEHSKNRSFVDDGITYRLANDKMEFRQVRLGAMVGEERDNGEQPWIFYASWNDWRYRSSSWMFWWRESDELDHYLPNGGGIEWRKTERLRFMTEYMHFWMEDRDLGATPERTYTNEHDRLYVGLTYSFW